MRFRPYKRKNNIHIFVMIRDNVNELEGASGGGGFKSVTAIIFFQLMLCFAFDLSSNSKLK